MRTLAFLLIASINAYAETHHALIPQPQSVQYGSASLEVRGLVIQVPDDAAAEDSFAASELARSIRERTGVEIPIKNKPTADLAIRLVRDGPIDAIPTIGEKVGPGSRESYRLSVNKTGVSINAHTSAGVFYGTLTLVQLVEGSGAGAKLPFVDIEDWPALAYRGTMIDMSEGPLANESEVFRQIEFIARWKGNQYYFYNEDSIELSGYPLLNPQARFSKEQVRRFIAYARERHIDVVPCLELYGHQHDLFRVEKYSSLADFPHGGEFDPANREAQAVLADWSKQYLDLFPSTFVHLGLDETWEIARAARAKGAGNTPARLFLTQLETVAQPFIAREKLVLAWGDMMVKFPDIAAQLPKNIVAVPWWYEPDPDPEYKKWLDPLVSHKVPLFVATGVNMWSEMAPDFSKSFRNIDTFLTAGKKAGALGMINTMWTDNQEALRRMGWPGIAFGASAAWHSNTMNQSEFFDAYAQYAITPAAAVDFAGGLKALSAAEALAQRIWGTEDMDAQWASPFTPKRLELLKSHSTELRQMRLLAEEAETHLTQAASSGGDPAMLNSLTFGSRVIDYAGMRSLYAVELAGIWDLQAKASGKDAELWDLLTMAFSRMHGRVGDIMDSLSLLIPDYRSNWLSEYTSYRMETALLHWNMEYRFWWRAQSSFEEFKESYHKGSPMPPIYKVVGSYSGGLQ